MAETFQHLIRVLLIEGDLHGAQLIAHTLRSITIPQFAVSLATEIDEARRHLRDSEYDVALLDLALLDTRGLATLKTVRLEAMTLPIIVLTTPGQEELLLDVLRNGAQEYLLKECIDPQRLVQAVRFAIQSKQLEEALKRSEAEQRNTHKLEAIGQLAAGIAHEINTPMQYIGDNLLFLRDSVADLYPILRTLDRLTRLDDGEQVDNTLVQELYMSAKKANVAYLLEEIPVALEQSGEGVERVTKIVRAMKEFSHPGTDNKRLVHLSQAIESTLTVCRNEWKYVAKVVTDIPSDLPPIPCYPGDLNQAFLNLIVNGAHAISYKLGPDSAERGQIVVSARKTAQSVEIRISDTGTGIPEPIRNRIFEPFFTTKDVGKGTGQGLAVAHRVIVDKHGGSIRVDTDVGTGTTFVISLPLEHVDSGACLLS